MLHTLSLVRHFVRHPITVLVKKVPMKGSHRTGCRPCQEDPLDEITLPCQKESLNSSKPMDELSTGRQERSTRTMDSNRSTVESNRCEHKRPLAGRHSVPLVINIVPNPDGDNDCHLNEHVHMEGYNNTQKDLPTLCLQLLQSTDYEDIFRGIQRLVVLVNGELVNSKIEGSVARTLVFGNDNKDDVTSRIRTLFPTFFQPPTSIVDDRRQDVECCRERDPRDVRSTDDVSSCSDLTGSTARLFMSMKLPALRILVSALELCSRIRNPIIDLSDEFWKSILRYMTKSIQNEDSSGIAAALIVKCLRLLRTMDPRAMEPYIKDSLLPSILNVKENGKLSNDQMLVRECDRLLVRL